MFSQMFGKYLVDEVLLNEDELFEINEKMESSRAKLGVLAVAQGIITAEEADRINQLQTQKDARFGTIATEEGYMTEEQLQSLLDMQGSAYAKFLSLISEVTSLSVTQVDEYLIDFQRETGLSDEEMESLKMDDFDAVIPVYAYSSKPFITDISGLALKNIMRFITNDFYIEKILHVKELEYKALVAQKLDRDANITIGFATCDTPFAMLDIANGFSGENLDKLDSLAYDSIGEFINCISGLFATAVAKTGVDLEMKPQVAYENQKIEGDAYVLPIYIHGNKVLLFMSVDKDIVLGSTEVKGQLEKVAGGIASADSKGRVLIVDDSVFARKVLRQILEADGYTVVAEAVDGIEGALCYKELKPDIVTMDITMPNLDGIGALKQIKAFDKSAKVIMVTAVGQQNKIVEALKIGAERFVTKPFEKQDILKNIAGVLGK